MTSFAQKMAAELNPDGISNLREAFDKANVVNSNKPAFACLGHTLTFSEFSDLTQRFANFLTTQLQLRAGDRIAVQLPNISQYPVSTQSLFGVRGELA